jgi:hypothetical protein
VRTNILDLPANAATETEVVSSEFDVSELIFEIAETTRVLVGGKPVVVKVHAPEGPLVISSDRIKLRRIVMHLASNVSRFVDYGEIRFTLAIIGSRLEIAVAYTDIDGKGEQSERRRDVDSWIAANKNLCELIDVSISAYDSFGKGSKTVLSLPFRDNQRQGDWYY